MKLNLDFSKYLGTTKLKNWWGVVKSQLALVQQAVNSNADALSGEMSARQTADSDLATRIREHSEAEADDNTEGHVLISDELIPEGATRVDTRPMAASIELVSEIAHSGISGGDGASVTEHAKKGATENEYGHVKLVRSIPSSSNNVPLYTDASAIDANTAIARFLSLGEKISTRASDETMTAVLKLLMSCFGLSCDWENGLTIMRTMANDGSLRAPDELRSIDSCTPFLMVNYVGSDWSELLVNDEVKYTLSAPIEKANAALCRVTKAAVTGADHWDGEIEVMAQIKASDMKSFETYVDAIGQEMGGSANSIASVNTVSSSTASGGANTIRITMTDGSTHDFTVYNGAKGDKGDSGSGGIPMLDLGDIDSNMVGYTNESISLGAVYCVAPVSADCEMIAFDGLRYANFGAYSQYIKSGNGALIYVENEVDLDGEHGETYYKARIIMQGSPNIS